EVLGLGDRAHHPVRDAEQARSHALEGREGGVRRHASILSERARRRCPPGGCQTCGAQWSVPVYRDEAVVLRTHKLGEADRIVTMLSRQHGKLRAVAKGVRRTGSRFGARLEPFMVVDVQCYIGRSLDIVQQAEMLGSY